ncbi:carbon-nitrogen hydrolase [Dentipellis sp. KUC8613]|nr:carbon-nitrogen hydrolase [Dentipellis sp. KUC8613]
MPVNLTPSNSDPRKFKVAAVQAEPVWLDLQGGVDKTIRLVSEAAAQGAKIIGLPEVFIPGYPWTPWCNNFVESQDILARYHANSLAVHSPEMDRIRAAVKKLGVWVVLGFSERDGGSLYIAQVTISAAGEIANHRRKIKPTHYEKTIFGDGSAQSIHNVVQTPYGRLGSLNCWEHMQPALKLHFYSQYPQIFVGGWWPAFKPGAGGSPYIVSGEASSSMTRSVAMEGGCFGLVCCHTVSVEGAELMKIKGYPWFEFPGGGFTTIYGPDGSALTPPIDPGVEQTAIAEISLDAIATVKIVADQMGNYSRHDLMHLVAHGKNWRPVEYGDEEEQAELESRLADVKNEL